MTPKRYASRCRETTRGRCCTLGKGALYSRSGGCGSAAVGTIEQGNVVLSDPPRGVAASSSREQLQKLRQEQREELAHLATEHAAFQAKLREYEAWQQRRATLFEQLLASQ